MVVACFAVIADQPFEPLFLNGGVPPLARDDRFEVIWVEGVEQLARYISDPEIPVLVLLLQGSESTHRQYLAHLAHVAAGWDGVLRTVAVDLGVREDIARALSASVGGQISLTEACGLLFFAGHAGLPAIMVTGNLGAFNAEVCAVWDRMQAEEESPGMISWATHKLKNLWRQGQRLWTTLVGMLFA